MTASDRSVTQQDHVAKPQKSASVEHIVGFSALRESLHGERYQGLSTGARALFTWVCLNSKWLGCAWRRLDALAKELGLNRRILCLKRRELEDHGLLRTVYIARGQALPTGRIARRQTAVFWPLNPRTVNQDSQVINDPTMIIHDRGDHGSDRHTLFCDQIIEEEGGRPPGPPDDPPPNAPEEPFASIATDLLQRWKDRLAPTYPLFEDPETYLEIHAMAVARLRDGVTPARAFASIEGFARSPHNQTWERRTPHQVFGSTERMERMASLGMSFLGMTEPKSEVRAKTLHQSTVTRIDARPHEPASHEALLRLIGRRKFEVQEIWKTATAKVRRGVGLGVSGGYPAQDLQLASEQVPIEHETWDGFARWFESAIVEWYSTGQRNPKFDATTSAFYRWLANEKKHPYVRPQDIKQSGSADEPWHKEF